MNREEKLNYEIEKLLISWVGNYIAKFTAKCLGNDTEIIKSIFKIYFNREEN